MTNATPSPSAPPSAPAVTTTAAASVQAGAAKVDPESLRLRAAPRAVMRLNRRMLAALVGTLGVLVLGGTLWSLQSPKRVRTAAPELHNVDKVARAEHLERLPKDYGKWPGTAASRSSTVPVLGEPLPGDLGAAMHAKRVADNGAYAPAGQVGGTGGISEADEAARSGVFFKGGSTGKVASASAAPATTVGGATLPESVGNASPFQALNGMPVPPLSGAKATTSDPTALQNRQEQKQAFTANTNDTVNRNPGSLQVPVSPYQVMAGTIIPAALITGINSDLPGQVIANVTESVYDTATGRYLLVPQGSRLMGRYDSQVAFGQRRVLLVWTRLILPDTSSIALDRLPGIDPAGYAGLEDGVDWHWGRILAGAALSTLLGVGAELAAPDRSTGDSSGGNRVGSAARQGVQDTVNDVGQEITKRNASIQPTLTIRPGFPMRVMVNKDLILRPYQPLFFVRGAPP
jgi:type IV secretion system protein TrbI